MDSKTVGKNMNTPFAIQTSADSVANSSADKPNEDSYLVDEANNIYIVADGVTRDRINRHYPNPSPAKEVSQLFVNVVHQHMRQNNHHEPIECLKQSIASANATIADHNRSYTEFAPSTVAIVAMIVDEYFYYAHIGDCSVYLLNSSAKQLTTPQTKLIEEHANDFSKAQIRDEISNNLQHPYAYGIINGKQNALKFVEYHQFKLKAGMRILIASDGLDILLHRSQFQYSGQSASTLIGEAEQIEQQNQQIRSDDKTAILIQIS